MAAESAGDVRSVDPIVQILLICARPTLDAALEERLRELLSKGVDWNALIYTAEMNLLVPLMAKHLGKYSIKYGDQSVHDSIIWSRNCCTVRMMRIEAIRRNLVHRIIEPLGARYALLKGAALSRMLYVGDFTRQYRDVDVLVEERQIVPVVMQLIKEGCRITNKDWDPSRQRDLTVVAQYLAAVELKTSDGIPIEIHRRLDNSGCVFDSQRLLRRVLKTSEGRVLPDMAHATYMCFHHARHRWSMLHWCADIAALRYGEPGRIWDAERYADSVGLGFSIHESLRLAEDLFDTAFNGTHPAKPRSKFFDDCMQSLHGSTLSQSRTEVPGVDDSEREPDFYYNWQKTTSYHVRFAISRLRPNMNDYNFWPLSRRWRWMYWFTRPLRICVEHLRLFRATRRSIG